MTEDTIFAKIIKGEIPADIVYQDDLVTAFRDVNPQAPTHILIVPNKAIPTAADVTPDDEQTLGRIQQLPNIGANPVHRRRATCDPFILTTFLCTLQDTTSEAASLYAPCNT